MMMPLSATAQPSVADSIITELILLLPAALVEYLFQAALGVVVKRKMNPEPLTAQPSVADTIDTEFIWVVLPRLLKLFQAAPL